MDISTFDIILLFILAIVVSMIIGYNIIYIIDKKISSVNINIPPIHVPKPSVTVKINRTRDNYDVYVDKTYKKNTNSKNEQKLNIKKEETLSNNINQVKMDVVEPFGNYAAANIKKN